MNSLKVYHYILFTTLNNSLYSLIHAPAFCNLILTKDDDFIVTLLMISLSSSDHRRYGERNCNTEIRLRIYNNLP